MLTRTTRTLISALLVLPATTFATSNGAAQAAESDRPFCFGTFDDPGDAAIFNVTPVLATAGGDGRLLPLEHLDTRATFSNVNFGPGTVDPNVAFAKVGDLDTVCFVGSAGSSVDVVVDRLGTIEGANFRFARADGAAERVADTRTGSAVGPAGRRCFGVAGQPGDVAVVNLTPVDATAAGNGQLTSSTIADNPQVASNVNYAPGTVDPNVALAPIGDDGTVCYVNSAGASVEIVADHLGTLTADVYQPARSDAAPQRVIDTRRSAAVSPGDARCFRVAGQPGDVAVVNLTPVEATGPGNGLLVSSDDAADPATASNVNYASGTVDPNLAFAKIGADRKVCFLASGAPVHLVADQLGSIAVEAFAEQLRAGKPGRMLDTRTQAKVTPISWTGPDPLMPTFVRFACAYEGTSSVGSSTRRVRFLVPFYTARQPVSITFYDDPQPNRGRDFVLDDPDGVSGIFAYVRTVAGPPSSIPYQTEWVGRVKIENGVGTNQATSTVFEIEDKCADGRLTTDGAGDSIADDNLSDDVRSNS